METPDYEEEQELVVESFTDVDSRAAICCWHIDLDCAKLGQVL